MVLLYVMEEDARWEGDYTDETSLWDLIGFPNGGNIGSTV